MVEAVLGDLEDSKCCQMSEDGDVSPLNLGMIAAYYYTQHQTIELIASSVTANTKIRGVTEILAASLEFSMLRMRFGEKKALARNLAYEISSSAQFNEPKKIVSA